MHPTGDLNIWNRHNPRERFWASRTRQLHASHVSTGDRLWSCLPYIRPLAIILHDSLAWYGRDDDGGRVHDLLGTRCDPYINAVLSGDSYDFHCHSNLTRAILPFGLTESDIHDVLNLFQVTGLDDKGRYFMSPCPARAGDCIEFLAEQDLLMALSASPPSAPHPLFRPQSADRVFIRSLHQPKAPAPVAIFLPGVSGAGAKRK